jgi:hypothetical protein
VPVAFSVTLPPEQNAAGVGTETVGSGVKVIVTSSCVGVQGALDIVQRNVYVFPDTPLNVVVGLDAFANDPPVPLITVQFPEPVVGVLPASVTEVAPHALV